MQLEARQIGTTIRDGLLIKKKREEIIQAASKVFTAKGYHKATIRNISEASGLGPGTIYNYIKKKEDILYLVYDKLTTILTESFLETSKHKDPLKQLKEALHKAIEIVWENQDLILLMYQETAALDKESRSSILKRESGYVSYMEKILKRGKKKGVIQSKNVRLASNIIVYLLSFLALRRWNLRKKCSEKKIKSGVVDFILKALCVKEDKNG